MNVTGIWIILSHTFKESIKAKWLIMFTAVFLLLAVNLPTLVLIAALYIPPNYLTVFLSNLVSLTFPFIPLLALPMGSTSIVDEREAGTLQYVLAHPITKTEFLLGRTTGLIIATSAVLLLGFGIAAGFTYSINVSKYTQVAEITLVGVLLNGIMIGMALIVSMMCKRKSTALSIAIFIWFFFTAISDLGFASVIVNLTYSGALSVIVILLNPIQAAQTLAAIQLQGGLGELGSTGIILNHYLGSNLNGDLIITLFIWLAVFVSIPFLIFRHQDPI
jgi:ABC-type transport system involved in multi-copper enzyme maturation permease subunit